MCVCARACAGVCGGGKGRRRRFIYTEGQVSQFDSDDSQHGGSHLITQGPPDVQCQCHQGTSHIHAVGCNRVC